jgi:putative membrane protein
MMLLAHLFDEYTIDTKIINMKKGKMSMAKLIVVASTVLTISCNSAQTHDDNDRTAPDNGSSHNTATDTSMTDTTRAVINTDNSAVNAAMSDTGLIRKNITDNMMEIQLSKVGRDKATSQALKKVAQQMVTEHTQMLTELKAFATRRKLTMPASQQMDMTSMPGMANASGKEFDKMWQSEMLKMHEAKIAELENVMQQTTDAEIKALASKALPKIKNHRQMLSVVKVE